MQSVGPARHELENLWRKRLSETERNYQIAKQATREAVLQSNSIPPADGQFGFRKAQRAETMALAEFRRVLLIFNDLVINGKFPPDA
jgi:hypothetical protein